MNGDKSVTAHFSQVCYTLSTSVDPSGSGTVSVNPSPNCGSKYTSGTQVQLTANPASGYSFAYWSGDASGSANPTTITMNSNKSVTAHFTSSDTTPVNISNTSGGSFWPAVAIDDAGNPHVVWHDQSPGNKEIYYVTKPDGGPWSTPVNISNTPQRSFWSTVAIGSGGTVHVLWGDDTPGNGEILYASKPSGGSWSTPANISNDLGSSYRPDIAIDDEDTLHVVWHDDTVGNYEIYYASKPTIGLWSDPTNISGSPTDSAQPSTAIDSNGTIHVVWDEGDGIYYAKKPSDGFWSTPTELPSSPGSSGGPAIAIGDDILHVVWRDWTPGNQKIYYTSKTSEGGWSTLVNMSSNSTINTFGSPAIAVDGVGTVHVVWGDDSPGNGEILHASKPSGGSWSTPVNISNNSGWSERPALPTSMSGAIHVVWEDDTPGNDEILYTTYAGAPILLVDDDLVDGYETYYRDALSANGYSFDNWEIAIQGSPPLSTLQSYSVVVWFTGNDYSTTLTDIDQANLQAYLDGGGNLFISGQDIGYDLTENGFVANTFFTDYLHANYVQDNVNLHDLIGVSGDPIGDGLYLTVSGEGGANNQNWPSEIDPLSPAVTVFRYRLLFAPPSATSPEAIPEREKAEPKQSQKLGIQSISSSGSGAIRACTEKYKVVYFAFGFEAINSATDRNTVMDRVVGWLSSYCRHPDCFGDFDCDCKVGVQDIMQVASRWRMTEADDDWDPWYDIHNDGIITVVDIMLVSAHWGETCP